MDADLSTVGMLGPFGVAESGAFNLTGIDGDFQEADHLSDCRGHVSQMAAGIDRTFGSDIDCAFLFLDHILDLTHGFKVRSELVFGDCPDCLEPESEFLESKEMISHQKRNASRMHSCGYEFIVMI